MRENMIFFYDKDINLGYFQTVINLYEKNAEEVS